MVRIRLKRIGKPKSPHYREVVIDSRKQRDGRPIETLGHYNPKATENKISINRERFDYWLKCGAQPSQTVKDLAMKQNKTQLQ